MEEIKRALELKEELDSLRPISQEQEGRIMQKFRLDWNYHSNHLEGNTLTYGETKALILFGVTAQGKPLKDTLEITGHNEAIDWVIDMIKGDRPLTENFIRELHKLLLNEPYEKKAISPDGIQTTRRINVGSYKTTSNHVLTATGEMFYFASPEETPAKMKDLMDWYNEKSEEVDVNPILLAAEFHYRFIRIHPFDDGNGRTARILMNFILMKFDFPPVIIRTEDKENYFAVLRLADAGSIEAFLDYIAQNLNRSLQIMISGAKGESIEEPDDLDKEIALLKQKLKANFDKIEYVKSTNSLNDIYSNTITVIVERLKNKLKEFEEYYLESGVFIGIGGQSLNVSLIKGFTEPIKEIKIIVKCDSLKIKGLEEFHFSYNLVFEFENLYYNVSEKNGLNSLYYKKHYENLSNEEIDNLVKIIVSRHNKFLSSKLK